MFSSILADARIALRCLRRNWLVSLPALFILAGGVGANIAVFSLLEGIYLRPLPFRDPEQLATIRFRHTQLDMEVPSSLPAAEALGQAPSLQDWSGFRKDAATVEAGQQRFRVAKFQALGGFFRLLGAQAALGRLLDPGDSDSVLLSHSFWRERCRSRPDIVGQTLLVDEQALQVIGVLDRDFELPWPIRPDIWTLLSPSPQQSSDHGLQVYDLVGRMKSGAGLSEVRSELLSVLAGLSEELPQFYGDRQIVAASLHESLVGNLRLRLFLIQGVAALLLLIIAVNLSALLLAASAGRGREFSIRRALGASRPRLVRLALVDGLVLVLPAFLLTLLCAHWLMQYLLSEAPPEIPRLGGIGWNPALLAFSLAASLCVAVLSSLAPLWKAWGTQADLVIQSSAPAARRGNLLTGAALAGQVALAIVILISSGLMINSLLRVYAQDPGIDSQEILVADIPLPRERYSDPSLKREFFSGVLERLAAIPQVEAASYASGVPVWGRMGATQFKLLDSRGEQTFFEFAPNWVVHPDYFKTMGIDLRQGRYFNQADSGTTELVAIVDQATARRFEQSLLGEKVEYFGRQHTIVGVVEDVKWSSLETLPTPSLYIPAAQHFWQVGPYLVLRSRRPGDLIPAVREIVTQQDPQAAFSMLQVMEEIIAGSVRERRYYTFLISGYGVFALLLVTTGLLGLFSYSVKQRSAEIGIRITLGAAPGSIIRLIFARSFGLALAGAGLGVVASLGLNQFLAGQLYQITAIDPLTYLACIAAMLLLVGLATYLPAKRALSVDPASTLRQE